MPLSDDHHPQPPQLTRRAALGTAAALTGALSVTLTGCEWGPPDQVAAPEAEQDADEKIVEGAAGQVSGTMQLAEAASKAYAALAAPLTPLLAVHKAHLTALDPKGVFAAATPPPADLTTGSAADSLAEIRSAELGLQRSLVTASTSVTSGPLAQTFASMAAAVAQQLAVLPTTIKESAR